MIAATIATTTAMIDYCNALLIAITDLRNINVYVSVLVIRLNGDHKGPKIRTYKLNVTSK